MPKARVQVYSAKIRTNNVTQMKASTCAKGQNKNKTERLQQTQEGWLIQAVQRKEI